MFFVLGTCYRLKPLALRIGEQDAEPVQMEDFPRRSEEAVEPS